MAFFGRYPFSACEIIPPPWYKGGSGTNPLDIRSHKILVFLGFFFLHFSCLIESPQVAIQHEIFVFGHVVVVVYSSQSA